MRIVTAAAPSPRITPYRSAAGIGWRCEDCGSTWSGDRAAHTTAACHTTAATDNDVTEVE